MTAIKLALKKISPQQLFMISGLVVNGGNYLYNLLLGRLLGPAAFAEAALLITMLLVLSFIGMTFQLGTAKFAVEFTLQEWKNFQTKIYQYAIGSGIIVGIIFLSFSSQLKVVFKTDNSLMFIIFSIGIPLYFVMSVNRGTFQGNHLFKKLSITYQTEMWSRLFLTFLLLFLLPLPPAILVALGITLSFIFGLYPSDFKQVSLFKKVQLPKEQLKRVRSFLFLTAGYELTQIIINNSDILLVKHYFNAVDAGLYASLALIGRVVYFVAWMFVMLLLPAVVQKKKDGEPTKPILFKYVGYISLLSASIVVGCYLFPEFIIKMMFGDAYLSMASLLWQYALATSLFAIANIFAYYFLSLDRYLPVLLTGILGISQIALIVFFHSSLTTVVQVQIIAMLLLLILQLIHFIKKKI